IQIDDDLDGGRIQTGPPACQLLEIGRRPEVPKSRAYVAFFDDLTSVASSRARLSTEHVRRRRVRPRQRRPLWKQHEIEPRHELTAFALEDTHDHVVVAMDAEQLVHRCFDLPEGVTSWLDCRTRRELELEPSLGAGP